MNNFTPEYIDLCKNEKVQGLRPELEIGDWLLWNDHIELCTLKVITPFKSDFIRSHVLFIPTGDQLDQEIVKICSRNYAEYNARFIKQGIWIADYGSYKKTERYENPNPLIAKISLLIILLEGE